MPKPLQRKSLLAFCRSLPHVTEDVKWGNDLVFSIGDKMFAGFGVDGGAGFGCKCSEDDFAALTELEGIVPAPYAARFFWISVRDPRALSEADAKDLLRKSYDLVLGKLPAKFRAKVAGAGAAVKTKSR